MNDFWSVVSDEKKMIETKVAQNYSIFHAK